MESFEGYYININHFVGVVRILTLISLININFIVLWQLLQCFHFVKIFIQDLKHETNLKWDGEHADDNIGQGQIRYKQIGDALHLSRCGHNPYDQ